jgi:hypothetical protein
MTFSSIACVTLKWLVSGSGWALCSFSKLVADHPTKPSGPSCARSGASSSRRHPRGEQPGVLDLVVGGFGDDRADGVVAGPPRAPRDLVELAGLERAGAPAVVLGEGREQDGADGHVDADAEGVRAADDLEQPGLRERLDQPPVARQHARVVHADAVAHQPRQRLPEARREPETRRSGRRWPACRPCW